MLVVGSVARALVVLRSRVVASRVGQVWEARGYLNGERVVVVKASREGEGLLGPHTVHTVLQLTGLKALRILTWTEEGHSPWETQGNMTRLA